MSGNIWIENLTFKDFFTENGALKNIVYRVHIADMAQYRVHIARILEKNIAQAWSWWFNHDHDVDNVDDDDDYDDDDDDDDDEVNDDDGGVDDDDDSDT